jgi:hypothetical protein
LLGVARSALAAPLPDGGVTVQDVAQVMRGKGYPVEIATAHDGDPLIRSTARGLKFGVFFYECRGAPRCHAIQFAAGFSAKNVTPEKIALWNRKKRFGRAYLDDSSEPWVEMDMDLGHGATTEALANDLDRWMVVMDEFSKYFAG